jgi:hypothetical protein
MQTLQQTLSRNPASNRIRDCIETCFDCALACTTCAAACTVHRPDDELLHCIRLDLDCADLCDTVGRALARQAQPDWDVLCIELAACAALCAACARECELHVTNPLDHFAMCAKACQKCIEHFRDVGVAT